MSCAQGALLDKEIREFRNKDFQGFIAFAHEDN